MTDNCSNENIIEEVVYENTREESTLETVVEECSVENVLEESIYENVVENIVYENVLEGSVIVNNGGDVQWPPKQCIGDGNVLLQGVKGFGYIKETVTMTGWSLESTKGAVGNISFDIWVSSTGNPDSGDSILDGSYLNLSSQSFNSSDDISGWTTDTLNEGDRIGFYVRSDSTLQSATLRIYVTKEN